MGKFLTLLTIIGIVLLFIGVVVSGANVEVCIVLIALAIALWILAGSIKIMEFDGHPAFWGIAIACLVFGIMAGIMCYSYNIKIGIIMFGVVVPSIPFITKIINSIIKAPIIAREKELKEQKELEERLQKEKEQKEILEKEQKDLIKKIHKYCLDNGIKDVDDPSHKISLQAIANKFNVSLETLKAYFKEYDAVIAQEIKERRKKQEEIEKQYREKLIQQEKERQRYQESQYRVEVSDAKAFTPANIEKLKKELENAISTRERRITELTKELDSRKMVEDLLYASHASKRPTGYNTNTYLGEIAYHQAQERYEKETDAFLGSRATTKARDQVKHAEKELSEYKQESQKKIDELEALIKKAEEKLKVEVNDYISYLKIENVQLYENDEYVPAKVVVISTKTEFDLVNKPAILIGSVRVVLKNNSGNEVGDAYFTINSEFKSSNTQNVIAHLSKNAPRKVIATKTELEANTGDYDVENMTFELEPISLWLIEK